MKKMGRSVALVLALLLASAGCALEPGHQIPASQTPGATTWVQSPTTEAEAPPASTTPEQTAPPETTLPETTLPETTPPQTLPPFRPTAVPSGERVQSNDKAEIDHSNTSQGYVMARYTAETSRRLKAQVKGPGTTYTFNLTPGQWAAFPLAQGNGRYKVSIYENVKSSKYALVFSASMDVELEDEFAPFLHANQFVNYDIAPETVAAAARLCQGLEPLEKVAAVYRFVVEGMEYDKELASSVKSGYVPDLDQVLAKKKGICFDYAALMTGMLRSQGVPCKLVVGYAGKVYHAWISVWSQETGWVEGIVFFDGTHWRRMDPTFASSAQGDSGILSFIQDDSQYTAKYFY